LAELNPRFHGFAEEVPEERTVNDYDVGPPEDLAPPPRKILAHKPGVTGAKGGSMVKKQK
jgi:hypothetical protein